MSSRDLILESLVTITFWIPVAEESEKLTLFFLSGVTVIPAIPISYLPLCTPGTIESNSISAISSSRLSFFAISPAISASIPITFLPS